MIDPRHDRPHPAPPGRTPAIASGDSSGHASPFTALGLAYNPFPDDPGAGPFIDTVAQRRVIDALHRWRTNDAAGPLAIVTAPRGSGKTRTLLAFRDDVANDNTIAMRILPEPPERRSDAQLLRDVLVAFGGEPTGRTGLVLQGLLRDRLGTLAAGGARPLLLIDGANFAGSQLEILRATLTDALVRIALFADPDLADRVARRRSLDALVGYSGAIARLAPADLQAIIASRLRDAGGEHLVTPAAIDRATEVAAGNPGTAVRLMQAALREARDNGQAPIDIPVLTQVSDRGPDVAGHPVDYAPGTAVQTRLTLPGIAGRETGAGQRGGAR